MTFDDTYLGIAALVAKHSKAKRKQVGAVLVTVNGVMLPGYNGTFSGADNACEDDDGVTLPTVLHAELNCLLKAAKEGVSVKDSTMYVTLSPCERCAAMLVQSGIKRLVYGEQYRESAGIELMRNAGVEVVFKQIIG